MGLVWERVSSWGCKNSKIQKSRNQALEDSKIQWLGLNTFQLSLVPASSDAGGSGSGCPLGAAKNIKDSNIQRIKRPKIERFNHWG